MFKVWLRSHIHLIILNLMVSSAVRKKYKTEQNYWVQSFKRWSKVEGTRKCWLMGNCHYTDGILLTWGVLILPDLVRNIPKSPGWKWLTEVWRKAAAARIFVCSGFEIKNRSAQADLEFHLCLQVTLSSWFPPPHTHTHLRIPKSWDYRQVLSCLAGS